MTIGVPNDAPRDEASGLPLEHRRPCPACGRVRDFLTELPLEGERCAPCRGLARGLPAWRARRREEGGAAADWRYHGERDPDR